ncbi:MAG: hypothetical protein FD155_1954 [Bacteroidetes bacterium]|nr:MAG: hypothetical protein FD155_1954 [Bacteroidota bacterium]
MTLKGSHINNNPALNSSSFPEGSHVFKHASLNTLNPYLLNSKILIKINRKPQPMPAAAVDEGVDSVVDAQLYFGFRFEGITYEGPQPDLHIISFALNGIKVLVIQLEEVLPGIDRLSLQGKFGADTVAKPELRCLVALKGLVGRKSVRQPKTGIPVHDRKLLYGPVTHGIRLNPYQVSGSQAGVETDLTSGYQRHVGVQVGIVEVAAVQLLPRFGFSMQRPVFGEFFANIQRR